jgi:tRNA pseudouridine38-40 synthase
VNAVSPKRFSDEMPDDTLSSGIFRYALGVEYRGTHYCGWQRQEPRQEVVRIESVQSQLESAIARVAHEPIITVCAGRTDSGVHGFEQVIHFETRSIRPLKAWILGVNSYLPPDISVLWAKQVSDDFHARFSATARTYRYVIRNTLERPAIGRELSLWIFESLDVDAMHAAAQYLLGENDFTSFRGASCQSKTPRRHLEFITVSRNMDWIVIEVKANGFLQHMVRNIVGSLLEVGRARKPVVWIKDLLLARNRHLAGATAGACGLYLLKVDYPAGFGLPQRGNCGDSCPL